MNPGAPRTSTSFSRSIRRLGFLPLTMMSLAIRRCSVRSLSSSTTNTPRISTAAALLNLKKPELLKPSGWNLSETVSGASKLFNVYNPAEPDAVVAQVAVMGQSEAWATIDASAAALPSWRDGTTAARRSQLLWEWSRLIRTNAADIATIMTLESGKPLAESVGEVSYGVSFLEYFAGEAIRSTGAGGGFLAPTPFSHPDGSPRGQVLALQQAVGVSALIAPWNFPLAMITRKVGPALAAGCTAVVKPSELTPLTALAVHRLALEVGIPPEVFQLVTASRDTTPEVGEVFCTHPDVRKVSFTGSTAVGKLLMQQCSGTVKRLSLELGGNAAFVVLEDADLPRAVDAAVASKFRNAGQTCVCSDRFLVHASVHDAFVDRLVERVGQLRVGSGLDPATTLGPLIAAPAVQQVHSKVQEALELGATLVAGGHPLPELGSHFYAPTVLTRVPPHSRLWSTETFGPVVAVASFEFEDDALRLANDGPAGLASYVCTRSLERALRWSRTLDAGMVGVNEAIISTAVAPFGGVKESGLGREGSSLGIQEYLETKYVFLNP